MLKSGREFARLKARAPLDRVVEISTKHILPETAQVHRVAAHVGFENVEIAFVVERVPGEQERVNDARFTGAIRTEDERDRLERNGLRGTECNLKLPMVKLEIME